MDSRARPRSLIRFGPALGGKTSYNAIDCGYRTRDANTQKKVFLGNGKMLTGTRHVAVYGFRPGQGGISHVMRNLMHAMVDEGVSVDLLLDDPRVPEVARLSGKIRVVPLLGSNPLLRVPIAHSLSQKHNLRPSC